MDAATVFTVLEKGLALIPQLISAGQVVIPLIARLQQVAKGGAEGTVTVDEVTTLERDLDAALEEFNAPLPPE